VADAPTPASKRWPVAEWHSGAVRLDREGGVVVSVVSIAHIAEGQETVLPQLFTFAVDDGAGVAEMVSEYITVAIAGVLAVAAAAVEGDELTAGVADDAGGAKRNGPSAKQNGRARHDSHHLLNPTNSPMHTYVRPRPHKRTRAHDAHEHAHTCASREWRGTWEFG